MKIYIDTVLGTDDMESLNEDFMSVKYTEKVDGHTGEMNYYEVSVETQDLRILEELEWIKSWLDAGFVLKYRNNQYML